MIHIVALFLALVLIGPAMAQEKAAATAQSSSTGAAKEKLVIPTTLEEAHREIERILPKDELAKIDAMKSEKDMIEYHMGFGMGIRNEWGLWGDGPLAQHLHKLGFFHPDDMSGVILGTFWCKRHGKDFGLKEKAAYYAKFWEESRKFDTEEKERVEVVKTKMRSMMMGLQIKNAGVPTVRMYAKSGSSMRARFLAPYRNGLFIAALHYRGQGDDDFVTKGYYYDPADQEIHEIVVPEITDVCSALVAGTIAWFTGVKDGKSVLLGIDGEKRIAVPLPMDGPPPLLGLNQRQLLVVYPKDVFTSEGAKWKHLLAYEKVLPKSGPPPELHGNLLFLRDEGRGQDEKRLWWLGIDGKTGLTSLDKNIKVVGSYGPRWENSFSYAVTGSGDVWASVGAGHTCKSLLHRSSDGSYSIAIMNNSLEFTPDLLGSANTDQGIAVSAVTLCSEGAVLLAGDSGIYRLVGKELTQEVAFQDTLQDVSNWSPSNIVEFHRDSYFMSGAFRGIYLLSKVSGKDWIFRKLDGKLGTDVTW